MRSHPAEYELVAPNNLSSVLSLLAQEPGAWLPIAGGTDLMVQYAAGHLDTRKLVSIWNLPELRRVEILPGEIRVGAGCTYTDLMQNAEVNREFSLLTSAARWTGGVANQNRGTLGGNIVNASPAADSLPALLVYGAELILVSVRGERRILYENFHTGYRKTQRAADEVIRCVCLPRQFKNYRAYTRKIGARNAQAISKVCLAALGRMAGGIIEDIRMAVGSVAPVPLRLRETEKVLRGKEIGPALILLATKTAAHEIQPIDDIRSSARYRRAVTANLVAEFLNGFNEADNKKSNVLTRWNSLPSEEAALEISPCCGSNSWARQMAALRPVEDENSLLAASDKIWRSLTEADWMEAFAQHPRIGQSIAPATAPARSAQWSSQEQQKVGAGGTDVIAALAEGNRAYEQRFNRIFIVCAAGKSAHTILDILHRRMRNDEQTELQESAEQQRQITSLRLKKWISE
ncbi:MAG TPA: 2-oxo-4-hydroxy-4-carboxy-5-ureidoimidazoline decarboxylase [Verrucomicrobiae bacterium]|jgi:OHCU decarboxylase|nr:2-oxo-4-hydroxy-4-carboxy-5-ureidoimidazoline decarboxylase [Verrucomicrobiae bacterium]